MSSGDDQTPPQSSDSSNSDLRWRATFEMALDAIIVMDGAGRVLEVNPAAEVLFGHAESAIVGGDMAALLIPERYRERHRNSLARFVAKAETRALGRRMELGALRSDGSEFPIELTITSLKTGAAPLFMGTVRDISERKRQEAEMERRTGQAVLHQSALRDLSRINYHDFDECLRRFTESAATTLGVERVGIWFYDEAKVAIVCADLYEANANRHTTGARVEAGQYPQYFRALAQRRIIAAHDAHTDPGTSEFSGTYLEAFGITSMMDVPVWRQGEVLGVICHEHTGPRRRWTLEEQEFAASVADMVSLAIESSHRRRVENELKNAHAELEERVRERTAELQAVFEAFPDLFFRLDGNGVILDYHAGNAADLFVAPTEFLNSRIIDVLPQETALLFFDAISDALVSRELIVIEYSLDLPTGRQTFEARVLPVSADQVVAIVRNISSRKWVEAALHDAKEEAERANRAKSEFLSRMSHELRTPMNSILGFAQVLTRKQLAPADRRSVDHILKAGRHLLELINEVLDIARIEANRMPLTLEPLAVRQVIHESLTMIQPLAAQRGCTVIDNTAPVAELYVLADRQRLLQIMLNLLSNAVKYNSDNGTVTLSCESEGNTVRIAVSDTGDGIAPEQLERLFVPFERLAADESGVEGTGLGLALSRGLAVAMGASLTAASTVGEGSTFAVELPRTDASQGSINELIDLALSLSPGAVELAVAPRTVLYIEDNCTNLSLVETILAERPHVQVLSAGRGRLGLELAQEHRPDLVLVDMRLPDMAGPELLRSLRADARTAQIPVVVMGPDTAPDAVQGIIADGAAAFLPRPFDVELFSNVMDDLL